jgi:hypothetical protein
MKNGKVEKRLKRHGAWMGIAWENMENEQMGPKHNS